MTNPLEGCPDDRLEMMIENCRIRLAQAAERLATLESEKERRQRPGYIKPELVVEHKRRGW